MALYAVSYDLHNVRHYQPVWDLLAKIGGVRVLESLFWLVIEHGNGRANQRRCKSGPPTRTIVSLSCLLILTGNGQSTGHRSWGPIGS